MTDYSPPELASANVNWANAGRVHEWRNYIGERTRKIWSTLTDEQRRAIAQDADDLASREEWD